MGYDEILFSECKAITPTAKLGSPVSVTDAVCEVLFKGRWLTASYHLLPKPPGSQPDACVVVAYRHHPGHVGACVVFVKDVAGDGFSYKPVDEEQGPAWPRANMALLRILSPTTDENARAWRREALALLGVTSGPIFDEVVYGVMPKAPPRKAAAPKADAPKPLKRYMVSLYHPTEPVDLFFIDAPNRWEAEAEAEKRVPFSGVLVFAPSLHKARRAALEARLAANAAEAAAEGEAAEAEDA